MPKFIKNELKSDSESDPDSHDKELMEKLKDSEFESKSNAKLITKLKKTSLWKNLNKNVIVIIDNDYGDYLLLSMIIDDY